MVSGESQLPEADEIQLPDAEASIHELVRASSPPGSGDVIVIGGWSKGNHSTATIEFFDQTLKRFFKWGSLADAEGAGAAVLVTQNVRNPEIVVAGGFGGKSKFKRRTRSDTITGIATNDLQIFSLGSNAGQSTAATSPAVASLGKARFGDTATVLNSGKILIAGGADSTGTPTNTAEVFDPVTNTTIATANNMGSPRMFHSATLLSDGTVLLAGGASDSSANLTASADIYDPDLNSFSPTGSMATTRAGHASVLLNSGDVLITGGAVSKTSGGLTAANSAEIFDPVHRTFNAVGNSMNDTRSFHTATLLGNGTVLLAGGFGYFSDASVNTSSHTLFGLLGSDLSSAEIFDPSASTFTCVEGSMVRAGQVCGAAMHVGRGAHTATFLATGPLAGQVLIAGGIGGKKGNEFATELKEAELFDQSTGTFIRVGDLNAPRGFDEAVELP